MNIIERILEDSKSENKYLSIWSYSDDETFWCGKILNYSNEIVTFQHYTKYGVKDGIIFIQLSQIKNIDFNDEYTKSIAYVIENSEKIANENKFEIAFVEDENWKNLILNQLNKKTEIISSVKVYGEYYSGFIMNVDEESFVIKCIDSLGIDQGLSMFKIDDLTEFKINDIDNRKRLLLYNWRKNLQIT
ncbi:hypothetical protein SAMN05660477_03162 [Soonwooa buanensis]|uniref:Uncharacterized protein n=1 Tax=Soonwooa buanensis TaxID=619805 RepID=A0A1T5GVD7_9FLAO|nr:hypothetical protein [Soonwooa buanensis]SKC12365.1 hypothetical protein SAMN05660477_03162 [Soonwooa buanensis]